jgi:hypothetical protein
MKIACLGNMNNMLFQIGRYLIDEKHEVKFFLFDEPDHFLPEADTFENINNYEIHRLGWNADTFLKETKKEIHLLFNHFNVLIGTDWAPAYLFKAGLRLDVYFPHGSDLYEYPFFKYKNNPPQLWEIPANIISKAQFLGIKEARIISLDFSDGVYEKPLRKIRKESSARISSPPYLYLKQYSNNYLTKSYYYNQFIKLKNKHRFIAFQQISQDWSMRGPYKIDKGNNHLINGFAKYLKSNPTYKDDSILILMEYGCDVEKSKKLINELEISNNVIWFKKMNRKDLMALISITDICVGELGYRAWYSYSSIMEFMAMKKPFVHHRNDAHYDAKGMDLYPMIDGNSSEKITETFIDYRSNPQKHQILGEKAYKWILNDTEKKLASIRKVLNKVNDDKKIRFYILKWICYKFNPHVLYNFLFLKIHQFKLKIKSQLA